MHEIAKELEKQSKEIIAFLQDKGIEVKAAQSSIEDDVAAMVRKAFGGSKADTETAKEKEAAPVTAEKQEETKKAEPEKAPEKPEAPAQGTSEPPKKKKKIIFVSNPHNSNFSSQQRPQGNNRPMQNQGQRPGGNRQGQGRAQEAPHKIIRPLTAPSVMESTRVDFRENARKLEMSGLQQRITRQGKKKRKDRRRRITSSKNLRPLRRKTLQIRMQGRQQETEDLQGPQEGMTGIRGMRDLRRAVTTIREKGITEMTPADLKEVVGQALKTAGTISAIITVKGIITDLVIIRDAAKEALRDRTIDLSVLKSRVKVSLRKPRLRMKSAEMKKSAESARKRISALRRTSCMKRTRQQQRAKIKQADS